MKKIYSAFLFSLIMAAGFSAPFTPGNLVVVRVGDGSAALTSAATALFLDEYTTAGLLVQSIALPTADNGSNQTLTLSGTATSEGYINLSTDRAFLTVAGYDAAPGTASVVGTSTASVVRVIGRISADGVINTTTTTTSFSTNNVRSVASTNGSDFWAVGAATGVVYTTIGSSGAGTVVSTTLTNIRVVSVYNGQLYISTGSGNAIRIGAVGTGTPTTTGQTITNIPGFPTTGSPYGFVFFDENTSIPGVDVLYVADDGSTGISKYSYNGTAWVANGTIAGSYRGLTGTLSSSGTVKLAATGTAASANTLVVINDASGYNATITGTPTTIITAPANTAFRGVALTPNTTILPVKLVSFAASAKNNSTVFTWKTATEQNTSRFEIEQSLNGKDFTTLATVAAAGNSTVEKNYSYTGNLNAATTYYRLKMIDADGKFTTSAVVKVVASANGFTLGNVYPVPATNKVTVEWNSSHAGATAITITDVSGRAIRTLTVQAAAGYNQAMLDVQSLSKGQYFIRLKNELNQVQAIITKQ